MKIVGALAAAGLLMTSCSSGLENKARKALAGQVTDVDAAQFRNLTESPPAGKTSERTICGEVKPKNGAGFVRFMVGSSGKGEAVIGNDPISSSVLGALLDTACKKGAG